MSVATTNYRVLGAVGEELACQFLRHEGFKTLVRNYTCPLGEIDLICRDGDTLVFVEVKARRSDSAGEPLESITYRKRTQIIRCAKYYLTRFGLHDRPCRFDAVSVKLGPDGQASIERAPDAFREGGL